jgi:CubicO group peptidase (beta-lactamase class C family)
MNEHIRVDDPAGAGVDEQALEALVDRARREVDAGLLPSCQLALAKDGRVVADVTLGEAMPDTRYVIFSASKPLTASVVWQLFAEGGLSLDDRIADHIPEFGANGKDAITLEQVMLHTSGFPRAPLGAPRWYDRDRRLEAFASWRLNWEPGTRYEYHPTSAHWVLAELVERVTGGDYRDELRRRVLDPLGLERLRLGVPEGEQRDVAELQVVGEEPTPDEWEAVLGIRGYDRGEVTDDALLGFNEPATRALGVPGGGAVSTAADLARFYQGLLHNPGSIWDPAVLADATSNVRNMLPDPLRNVPASRTVGLMVAGDDGKSALRGFGHTVSPRAFGHDGAGGQIAFADPATGLSFAYLTNGLDAHLIREWRRTAGIASKAATCAPAVSVA